MDNAKKRHYNKVLVNLHLQIVNMIIRYKEIISRKRSKLGQLIEEWNLLPFF